MDVMPRTATSPVVTIEDPFWTPRLEQLRQHTLGVLGSRLEHHGVMEAVTRLSLPASRRPARRGLPSSDVDLFRWVEACCLAGTPHRVEPYVDAIVAAQQVDGYFNSAHGVEAHGPGRYVDLGESREWAVGGALVEAAIAHHQATGDLRLLNAAVRWANHLLVTFGPGLDTRVDAHPGVELALVRLAGVTGTERYVDQARWIVERTLEQVGTDLERVDLAGPAPRALRLASAIAEVAIVTRDLRWRAAAERLFLSLVSERSYPTGAVGGRWLDGAVGRPFELPDDGAHAESCAAVAALQFSWQVWRLSRLPEALDHAELLLYNAIAAGVGSDGESWFRSQPHACSGDGEGHPWASPSVDGSAIEDQFPVRRHSWFAEPCCPTELARAMAGLPQMVAEVDAEGHLRIHLPLACRIEGGGWQVEVRSAYPWDGAVEVETIQAPRGRVALRVPGWAGGKGHRDITASPRLELDVRTEWWEADPRVSGARGTAYLRRGPIVYCVEAPEDAGYDLRAVTVEPGRPLDERDAPMLAGGVRVVGLHGRVLPTAGALYHRLGERGGATGDVELTAIPYAARTNRGLGQMTILLRR